MTILHPDTARLSRESAGRLTASLPEHGPLIIDLSGLVEVEIVGAAVLFAALCRVRRQGAEIRLVVASPALYRALLPSRLYTAFDVCLSVEEAVAELSGEARWALSA